MTKIMSINYSKCVVCGAAASNRVEQPKTLFKFFSNANAHNDNEKKLSVLWNCRKNRYLRRIECPSSVFRKKTQIIRDQCRWWDSKNVNLSSSPPISIIVFDNCFDSSQSVSSHTSFHICDGCCFPSSQKRLQNNTTHTHADTYLGVGTIANF